MTRIRPLLPRSWPSPARSRSPRCGEKEETLGPKGETDARADARLLPQRRPRRDLRGAGERRLQGGRARREDPPARRPVGADQAGRGRPRRPGDLLRARGAARARQGAQGGRRRRARARAADLDHLAARQPSIRSPKDLKGKRSAPPGSTTRAPTCARSCSTPASTPSTVKERNVGFGLNAALLAKKVDATLGAFWNYEGVELQLRSASARGSSRSRTRACRPTTSSCWWPTRTRSSATATSCARSSPRWRAARASSTPTPTKGIEGLLEANPDLDPKLQRAVGEGDAAAVPAAEGQAVRLSGPRGSGRSSPRGCARTSSSRRSPTPPGPSPTTTCRARDCDPAPLDPYNHGHESPPPPHVPARRSSPLRSSAPAAAATIRRRRRRLGRRPGAAGRRRSRSRSRAPSSTSTSKADLEGLPARTGPCPLRINGPVQVERRRSSCRALDWDVDVAGARARSSTAAGPVTDDNAYVEFQGQAYEVGAQLFGQFKRATPTAEGAVRCRAARSSSSGSIPPKWLDERRGRRTATTSAATRRARSPATSTSSGSSRTSLKAAAVTGRAQAARVDRASRCRRSPKLDDEQIDKIEDAIKSRRSRSTSTRTTSPGASPPRRSSTIPRASNAGGLKGGKLSFDLRADEARRRPVDVEAAREPEAARRSAQRARASGGSLRAA